MKKTKARTTTFLRFGATGGYIFSISSIWAPSGASIKATWWPLLPTCSSMMCAPLLLSLAIAPA